MNLLPRNSQALQGSDPLPQIETFVTFCCMVELRGVAGEGLRSVGVAPTSPIQERVLYPAHRSTFKGRGILRGPSPFIWFRGAKEGRPRPLHIRQPTQRRTY